MNKGYRMMLMSAAFALTLSIALVTVIGMPAEASADADATESVVSLAETEVRTDHYAEVGTRVLAVEDVSASAPVENKYDVAAVTELVSFNRVFGDSLYDDSAVIDAAQIVLLDKATEIDGFLYIEKQTVNDYVYNMYGRRVDENAGEIYGLEAPEGYYAILPRSYDLMSHTVTDISVQEDGKLAVTTEVTVAGLDFTEIFSAITLLSPAQTESGYVILSAQQAQ